MMKDEVKRWLDEQFAGDDETIKTVWSEYLQETAFKLEAARAALAARDCPELDRIAHAMKGNALMVGDQALVAAAIELRDAAKLDDAQSAANVLGKIAAVDAENRA